MSDKILFSEVQRFTQTWIKILLFVINGATLLLFLYILTMYWNDGGELKSRNSELSLWLSFGFTEIVLIGVTLMVLKTKMITEITYTEIRVKYLPFKRKFISYSWNEISDFKIRKYNPVMEYGGWGYNKGVNRRKTALNVAGNEGIELTLNNGKKVMIGTQSSMMMHSAVKKIKEHLNEL